MRPESQAPVIAHDSHIGPAMTLVEKSSKIFPNPAHLCGWTMERHKPNTSPQARPIPRQVSLEAQ